MVHVNLQPIAAYQGMQFAIFSVELVYLLFEVEAIKQFFPHLRKQQQQFPRFISEVVLYHLLDQPQHSLLLFRYAFLVKFIFLRVDFLLQCIRHFLHFVGHQLFLGLIHVQELQPSHV